MKNWKDTAEILGIAAIVASLIFVGMEMRQSQKIAVAAQYHERTSLAIEWLNSQYDGGDLTYWQNRCFPNLPSEMTVEFAGRTCIAVHSAMLLAENNMYQYQAGFLDEESWQARRGALKELYRFPAGRTLIFDESSGYRESFVELGKILMDEVDKEIR